MDIKIQNTHLKNRAYKKVSRPLPGNDFKNILDRTIEKNKSLKVSKHAEARMRARNLNLSGLDIKKLEDAVNKLEKKGSRESLILYKDIALVTSVENRTIITALGQEDMELVTNIDSAIIVK